MAIRCSVFIACSLDGFIARRDGSLDWLPGSDGVAGEDYGYAEFFAGVDALVMGRNTYETALRFPQWPYTGKPVWVLSHRYPATPRRLVEGVEGTSLPPRELLAYLEGLGHRHVYIDGGQTIQAFLRAGLVHSLVLTRVPVLLGDGIPLFGPLEGDIPLLHVSTRAYANGLVQGRYMVG